MRRLNTLAIPGTPSPIHVCASDSPGYGDPNLRYDFAGFNTVYNGSANARGGYPAQLTQLTLFFHDDYGGSAAPNGITENAALTAVIDHLQGKQSGPRACPENASAIEYLAAAMQLLTQRDLRLSAHVLHSVPHQPVYALAS